MTLKARSFTAPVTQQMHGRLIFPNGTSPGLTVRGGHILDYLFQADFQGSLPTVTTAGETVTVHFRDIPIIGGLLRPPKPSKIILNTAVPWKIEVEGGVGEFRADLQGIVLESLAIAGGVSRMALELGSPSGTVPIRITRGAAGVSIRRPSGVPVNVRIDGGASKLILDDQQFGAVGSSTRWESPAYASSEDRYAIHVTSGVSDFSVLNTAQ